MSIVRKGELGRFLTEPNLTLASAARRTFPGQAHFAEAASIKTCRECRNWQHIQGDYFSSNSKKAPNQVKPARCRKYRQFSGGVLGDKVPHDAGACRHFEQNPSPPASERKL